MRCLKRAVALKGCVATLGDGGDRCPQRLLRYAAMLATFFVLTVVGVPGQLAAQTVEGTDTRPNILVFLSDDMGWGQPGFNGGTEVATPNMDRLANEGVKLTQFYVQPVCSPTRASLMTGRYAWKNGMELRTEIAASNGMLLDERTIAEALRDAGYATWMVGKWHLGQWRQEHLPLQRGFDHHYGFYSARVDSFTLRRAVILDWHRNGRPVVESGYSTFLLADEAVQLIERHEGNRPFFLYMAFGAVHVPHDAPDEYIVEYLHLSHYKQRAMLAAMDVAMGQVMDALDRKGVLDNTLIVFLNDNGGLVEAGGNEPYRGLKGSYFEGGIRVPAALRWPGHIPSGSESDALLHVVDLFPTFARLAGAASVAGLPLDGLDAWETIAEGAESPREEVVHSLDVIRVGDWKLIEQDALYYSSTSEAPRLYNINEDPYEETNLADSEAEKITELRERLAYHRPFARDGEAFQEIPDFPPVVYGAEENAAFRDEVQTALEQLDEGNPGPALLRIEVSGTSVKLVYDEALDAASEPPADAFTVVVNPGYRSAEVVGVEVSGSEVVLTLAQAVAGDNTVGLTYEVPDTGAIQDADSLEAVGVTWVTETSVAPPPRPPPPPPPLPPPPPPRPSPNVTPATEPDAPTGLSATVSDQRVDLIWTAPASNGGAPILRYEYELDFSGTWTSTGGTATSYTVTGLTNGQPYRFRVRAVNRVGAGLASSSRAATPTSTVVAPDAPFGLSATPGNGQVMLTWVQPSGGAALTHYEYEQDGSGTWISTGGTAPSYTVTGLTNGQFYTFRVRAVNSAGQSAASNSRTATPTTTAPEAPESLRFTPGGQQVTLRWRAPTNDGGEPITHYEYEQDGSGTWISTGSTATSHTVTGLNNGQTYIFRVRAVNALGNGAVVTLEATPSPSTGGGGGGSGGGGGGGVRQTVPDAPRNLLAAAGDGQVVLSWDAPENDGGSEITDYQYRINGRNPWIAIGSTLITHTVSSLVNGTVYVFEVRAVNRIGRSRASNRAEATPIAPVALDFAHFANGTGITSDLVFVNVATHPIRPAIYFYDTEGGPIAAESVVEVTGDLEVAEDGSLSVLTEMEPLGELTISTHGQGELVSGSVKVVAFGAIGGVLRFDLPEVGVAGVGASPPVRDAVFPVRRRAGGINTGVAIHNLESSPEIVRCELMREGVLRDAVSIPLAANGQSSWFIDAAFPAADTSDFAGSVQCDAEGPGRFTAVALELDAASGIFTTLPVLPVRRAGGRAAELDFAHFANGAGITSDLVFVNLSTERSRPAPTPFHSDILPARPALYFYDTEGEPIAAESVVDITGDLEVMEDGGLTVRTEMEPLGVLTISTHGQGPLVSGSVRVAADEPIGGVLRFDLPGIGVAGVGASQPTRDVLFPVRRQEGGINTGVAVHNLGEEAMEVTCELMQGGTVLDDESISLAANGQTSWFIDQAFPAADTSDFTGSVRCDAVGEGRFSAVALEIDPGNRIFTTLPVVPVAERMDQE